MHWDDERGCYADIVVHKDRIEHIRHTGYISIYPLLFALSPKHRLDRLLDLIRLELSTPHGLRSLSQSSSYYMQGDQYWTGPIWVNINYLLLSALSSPQYSCRNARHTYNHVRQAIISTVVSEWEQTGFLWEQYNDESGRGQRTFPFTGWTSLVVLIMAERYV